MVQKCRYLRKHVKRFRTQTLRSRESQGGQISTWMRVTQGVSLSKKKSCKKAFGDGVFTHVNNASREYRTFSGCYGSRPVPATEATTKPGGRRFSCELADNRATPPMAHVASYPLVATSQDALELWRRWPQREQPRCASDYSRALHRFYGRRGDGNPKQHFRGTMHPQGINYKPTLVGAMGAGRRTLGSISQR